MICKIIPSEISGEFAAPPSKSETHRALICAYFGGVGVKNASKCDDAIATQNALNALQSGGKIQCGASGSTLRFMLPIAAALGANAEFICDSSLLERPLSPILDTLKANGVTVELKGNSIFILGKLRPGRFEISGDITSQYVSGLLFALPLLEGDSELVINGELHSSGYVDLTIGFLEQCHINCIRARDGFLVSHSKYCPHSDFYVGGDWSGASALLAAGVLGGYAKCDGLDTASIQPDRAFVKMANLFGAPLSIYNNSIIVKAVNTRCVSIDVSENPDLVPVLCALASVSKGTSVFSQAQRLAFKETNRLQTICDSLRSIGADISNNGESITVHGKTYLDGGECSSFGDHRIAMALAAVSPRCRNPVVIDSFESVTKSYPGFAADFSAIGGVINVI